MLLLYLSTCLDNASQETLHAIDDATLQQQILDVIKRAAHAASAAVNFLEALGEPVDCGIIAVYLSLVLTLKLYALLLLPVILRHLATHLGIGYLDVRKQLIHLRIAAKPAVVTQNRLDALLDATETVASAQ